MKKIILMLSLATGFISIPTLYTNANCIQTKNVFLQEELTFSSIALSDLPSAVKDAALDAYKGLVITEAKMATTSEGTKVYKLTLSDIDANESTVFYNEDGSKYKK